MASNGLIHNTTLNARQLPSRRQDKNGSSAIVDDSLIYDANGNLTDITDQAQGGLTTCGMAYDARDRLRTVVAPGLWDTATYSYDALDNLRTASLGDAGYSYGYDSKNRLSSLTRSGGSTYAYATDARGNIQSDGRQSYAFDERNRLTEVTGKESYRYDGLGRRVYQERPDGSQTVSQYSQAGQLAFRWDKLPDASQRTREHIYLGGRLIASIDHAWPSNAITAIRYQHTDALGSPVATTDQSKVVIERTQYAPYGAPFNRPVDGVGYTGHVMDQATGLVNMQQRYLDPLLGRALSIDPMAVDTITGWNFSRYAYAANNPYTFVDPDGREACGSLCKEKSNTRRDRAEENRRKTDEVWGSIRRTYGARPAAPSGSKTFGPLGSGYVPAVNSVSSPGMRSAYKSHWEVKSIFSERSSGFNFVAADGMGIHGTKGTNNQSDSLGGVLGAGLSASHDWNLITISRVTDGIPASVTSATIGGNIELHGGVGLSAGMQATDGREDYFLNGGFGLGGSFEIFSVDYNFER